MTVIICGENHGNRACKHKDSLISGSNFKIRKKKKLTRIEKRSKYGTSAYVETPQTGESFYKGNCGTICISSTYVYISLRR